MPPSLNFPQLDFVKPSSWFHPVTWERVTLEHDALCEELATCQAKCFGLEQDVAI